MRVLSVSEAPVKPRRVRSQRLPFQELDLAAAGLISISMSLHTRLHKDAARALRKLGEKSSGKNVALAASRSYRTADKQPAGVELRVEVDRSDNANVELEYRRQNPIKRKLNFDKVWGLVVYPASTGAIPALVIATVELTEPRLARLPLRLPMPTPELPETVGRILGVRFVREFDGNQLYEAWLDLRRDRYDLTLLFQREVTQVATAAEDLLRATTELLDVFLLRGQVNGGS